MEGGSFGEGGMPAWGLRFFGEGEEVLVYMWEKVQCFLWGRLGGEGGGELMGDLLECQIRLICYIISTTPSHQSNKKPSLPHNYATFYL